MGTAEDRAISRLREIAEIAGSSLSRSGLAQDLFMPLRYEAAAIVASLLGSDHYLVAKLDKRPPVGNHALQYQLRGESPVDEFVGLVNAAISLLGSGHIKPASEPRPVIADPDLWEHLEQLVTIEAWAKIPAVVATFTEDWFRRRGADPRGSTGGKLVGKGLFSNVLTALPLGSEESEHAGWRFLGMGLMQAIGNAHRHNNIDRTEDAEQFAWGVIGLASLLIGEMKRTHPAN